MEFGKPSNWSAKVENIEYNDFKFGPRLLVLFKIASICGSEHLAAKLLDVSKL